MARLRLLETAHTKKNKCHRKRSLSMSSLPGALGAHAIPPGTVRGTILGGVNTFSSQNFLGCQESLKKPVRLGALPRVHSKAAPTRAVQDPRESHCQQQCGHPEFWRLTLFWTTPQLRAGRPSEQQSGCCSIPGGPPPLIVNTLTSNIVSL